jgi:hypothetical protein
MQEDPSFKQLKIIFMAQDHDRKKEEKQVEGDKRYPENGDNFKPGKEAEGSRPNNPAENAERTSPEEDQQEKRGHGAGSNE